MSAIDHPNHYNVGSIEVIDAIEDWCLGFHLGNVVKYIARAPHKGKLREDLEKARWYLQRFLTIEESRQDVLDRAHSLGPDALNPLFVADDWKLTAALTKVVFACARRCNLKHALETFDKFIETLD